MRHDAAKHCAPFVKCAPHLHEERVLRLDAGSMIVGVDFDQDWQGVAPFGAPCCDQTGHLDVVEYDRQLGPTSPQVEYVLQLVRCDTNGIKQIGEAMIEKILRFSKR
jgi:hypothetical protein